jgi:hypothetical protein
METRSSLTGPAGAGQAFRGSVALMTQAQVVALLEKNKQQRGIEHWKRLTGGKSGKSFGLARTS